MEKKWWHEKVAYQIYPKSFYDSNGDGIGDIPGIIEKLDYLKALGVDIVWISPCYPSPFADQGYDISDYYNINPVFGTLEDMDRLLAEAKKRDMYILLDLVVNHCSDEHEWFQKACEDPDGKYGNFFYITDKKEGELPCNWRSYFGGPVWETLPGHPDKQYLHVFHRKQPDLNWENPMLREEIYSMINRWFDKGVDGFRMDVISLIAKAPGLPNGQGTGYVFSPEYFAFQPKLHSYLREMRRRCFDGRTCMCVGETTFVTVENANTVVGDGRELDLLFQFDLMDMDSGASKWDVLPFSVSAFKQIIARWQTAIDWNTLFLGNHDQPRVVSRFGCTRTEDLRVRSAKCLAAAMYLLRGTPFLYQGEEIGMTNFPFTNPSQLRDIESIKLLEEAKKSGAETWAWNGILHKGRDNARTPMQWDRTSNAGFTTGDSWIAVNPNYPSINVEDAISDDTSILHFYRKLIALRNDNDVLKWGTFQMLLPEHQQLMAYERRLENEAIYVFCNISDQSVKIPVSAYADILLSESYVEKMLMPYGLLVYAVSCRAA